MSEQVWYVAYGSNMSAARLACYLEGGCPPGGRHVHPGARDATAPVRTLPLTLPGSVFFAGESRVWGGGRAFYDPEVPGPTLARGYLLTREQFEDVHGQEAPVYDRQLEIGVLDGLPMYTFTSIHGRHDVVLTRPAGNYLQTIGAGIAEAHGWDRAHIDGYLAGLAGTALR